MSNEKRFKSAFLETLEKQIILADGAMGTQIYANGVTFDHCFDELNLSNPDLIQKIHREYISAGANLIETNTFGANRVYLETYGLEKKVRDINFRGAKIAREAREVSGEPVFVAGSVGPIVKLIEPFGKITLDEIYEVFKEQILALLEGGVDVIILETFPNLKELKQAIRASKDACDLPIIAQMTFNEDGNTAYGNSPQEFYDEVSKLDINVIGINCSVGPQGSYEVIHQIIEHNKVNKKISAMPNAGLPKMVGGRHIYLTSPEYFAEYTKKFLELGVNIIGGCCGTTPEHIKAMKKVVDEFQPQKVEKKVSVIVKEKIAEKPKEEVITESSQLAKKLKEKKFVISVEIDPPKGINPKKALEGAKFLKEQGVDFINVADSPMARLRMSAMALAHLIQSQVGVETILHYTCRDRNLMALQSELLGGYAMGLRNILALTGDPPSLGNYPNAKAVYDTDAIGLIHIIKKMNEGTDWAENSIGMNANFFIGAALNPVADDLEKEYSRFEQKIEGGAHFIMTQPIYEPKPLEEFRERFPNLKIPVLVGVLPLHNSKHTEFLHNEVPGITIPDKTRQKMKEAGEQGIQMGIQLSIELLEEIKPMSDGIYLMPSFGRYEVSAEVMKAIV